MNPQTKYTVNPQITEETLRTVGFFGYREKDWTFSCVLKGDITFNMNISKEDHQVWEVQVIDEEELVLFDFQQKNHVLAENVREKYEEMMEELMEKQVIQKK